MTTDAAEQAVLPQGDDRPSPFALLFAPDRAMERQAKVGRALFHLAAAWVASVALGVALVLRVDAGPSTLKKLEMMDQLKNMSDRQIAEETHNAERLFDVATLAKRIVGPPVALGLACVAVLFLCWFFRGRIKGSAVVPVAAATLWPSTIATAIDAVSAFRHAMIPPDGVPLAPRSLAALLELSGKPLMGSMEKLGSALDFFSLWAAVMMAFGVAATGSIPKRTAILGTLAAWVCYQLVTHVAVG